MKTHRPHATLRVLLALAGFVLAGARPSIPVRASAAQAGIESRALHNLDGWTELQADFNQDQGVPRLVLLLSPT